ncbi:glycosyltransferase family A protein [Pleurocapsa sp. PCC 7319]|uniref:glycosyltransferase family 2 protein n=1 Tax=Pleurocapsa sp. PCC 7319 TaxID=118161 RepID=UPI00034827B4|nr:glycosyltransferase family A protein [Pleurocapsa sp. PCC 7319]
MAKVSVIVPNYNHASYLKQRLDSIYQQTYQDFEVILLDDCSNDNSREILQSYADMMPNTTFAPNQSNSGSVFRQWRKGVELSQGEYIWIAESDDYASSFFLKRLVEIMERWPNVGLAYTQSWMVDVQGHILGDANCWTNDLHHRRWHQDFINSGRDEIVKYITVKNTIPNASAVLIRKQALKASGGIITHPFRLCGDWLQWIKILAQSDIAFISDALNFWRQKSSNARIASAGTLEWIEGEQVLSQGCNLLGLPEAQTNKILLHFLKQCWQWQKDYIDQLS